VKVTKVPGAFSTIREGSPSEAGTVYLLGLETSLSDHGNEGEKLPGPGSSELHSGRWVEGGSPAARSLPTSSRVPQMWH
jgi:hypothetical protein